MMKKPGEQGDQAERAVRRARRRRAGRAAGRSRRTTRPADEQEREQELRVRVRDRLDPAPRRPRSSSAALQHDPDHQGDDGDRDPERDERLGHVAERREQQVHERRISGSPMTDAEMLARDEAAPRGVPRPSTRSALAMPDGRRSTAAAIHPRPADPNHHRDPLRSPRPVRRAPRTAGASAPGRVLLLVALPLAPQVPGALSAGGFILDDLESARAKALLEAELARRRRPSSSSSRSPTLEAGTPAFELAAAEAMRDIPTAPHVGRRRLAPARAAPGLGRPPHRLRHRLPRPAAGRLARGAADPARAPARRARPRRRAGRRPGLLRRRPDGLRGATSSAASSSRCRWRRSPCCSSSGRSSRPACPLVVGGAAVVVALAAIFLVASVTPMSIFVLNLATLLGLGLGVDYSLLMTSRFREELARRPRTSPTGVGEAVRVTVATAGRAVFFSGLTVLLGLLGLVLFEFMILRSVGIAGAIVVGLAVAAALTLLPAVLTLLGPRLDRFAVRTVTAHARRRDGPWARLARRVMRHPVAVLVPTLGVPAPARLAVPARPVQRAGRHASCRPTSRRAPPSTGSRREFGEGEFAPIVLAIRTDGAGHDPGQPGRACTTTRAAWRPTRGSRRVDSLVDVDPRLTLDAVPAAVRRPQRAARPLRRDRPGRDDPRRPDGLHPVPRPTARTATRARRWSPTCATRRAPLAPPAGVTVLVGGGAADVDRRRRTGSRADFPRTAAVHHRHDLPRAVRAAALGRPAGQGAGHEHAVDRGQLRRPGLDLPGRQPVGAPRLPAARVRRDDPAGHPVLRPVRAVDGLRGLPAVADEGGLGPDRRQHRGGRPRPGAERPDRDLARRSSWSSWPARSRSPTSCSSRRSASAWPSRSRSTRPSSGRSSCRRRCACWATGTGGCRPGWSGSSASRLPASEAEVEAALRPMTQRRRSAAVARWPSCRRSSWRPAPATGGPDPGQPDARPGRPSPPPTAPPVAAADPQPVGPAARRRPARPADRVVVLHRPPARPTDGRRFGFEYVIFRAERGAFPTSVGLAPGDHRRDRRPLPLRPAPGGRRRRWTARRAARPASRPASTWR